jgi:hypothetical protein
MVGVASTLKLKNSNDNGGVVGGVVVNGSLIKDVIAGIGAGELNIQS